jgi:hypothetical protein
MGCMKAQTPQRSANPNAPHYDRTEEELNPILQPLQLTTLGPFGYSCATIDLVEHVIATRGFELSKSRNPPSIVPLLVPN